MNDDQKKRKLRLPLPYTCDMARAMVFVDGENLAIRYKEMLRDKKVEQGDHLSYMRDVYVWSVDFISSEVTTPAIMRSYYYTAVTGDENAIQVVEDGLKRAGIEAPRVFRKKKAEQQSA